jgi:hypothetical protein
MKSKTANVCAVGVAALLATACGGPVAKRSKAATTGAGATASSSAELEAGVPHNPLKEAYFGETHVHTAYSLDAYIGGTRLTPFEAYQFAQGAEVEVNGIKHKLDRPLDWVAVTDHAEYIGEMYTTMVDGAPGHDEPLVQQLRGLSGLDERRAWFAKYVVKNNRGDNPRHPDFYQGPATMESAWKDVIVAAANQNNHPGSFTALIGFEWTAAPGGANLHRNVIFRDDHVPDAPVSSYEIPREEALWDWLEGLEARGMKPLAIPHNSNASKGLMFGAATDSTGKPFDAAYASRRAHMEPLVEIMQVKGSSEVHRSFWTSDEFADFENADSLARYSGRELAQNNYVRWAVTEGLAWEQRLGVNPFKVGFVGGTDNHNGLSAETMEAGPYGQGWKGAHGEEDGTVDGRRTGEVGGWIEGKDENPGSLTGVWAASNTRGAIWDAMKRRETFATSGTRIKVRFFGGWDFAGDLHNLPNMVERATAAGVPMGGDLGSAPEGKLPTFVVWAIKDPEGANLDRIQLIKGWVDEGGKLHEKIVNVAWSGDREFFPDGRLQPVENTVDLATATYTNTVGAAELRGSWYDRDFVRDQPALYYLRVLEIPTPRWSTYDAVRNGLPLLEDVPATIQERAWTSPVWYTP